MKWEIIISPLAERLLDKIGDRRIRTSIVDRIDHLAYDPDKQGKPLRGELAGYRSIRAASQRYRILYNLEAKQFIITVVILGIRRDGDKNDVYEIAKKLKRAGLLGDE